MIVIMHSKSVVMLTYVVLHNICNMCSHDLPDMSVLVLMCTYVSGKSLLPMLHIHIITCVSPCIAKYFIYVVTIYSYQRMSTKGIANY